MATESKELKLSDENRIPPVRFTSTGQKLSSNEREIVRRRVWQELTYIGHPDFWKFEANGDPWQLGIRLGAERSASELADSLVGSVGSFRQQLNKKEETDLFLRMNYARFRLSQEIPGARNRRISNKKAREILRWHSIETDVRAALVRSNLPLVLYLAKKIHVSGVDFGDIVSEGNMALLRAVDRFDCSRGFKFSTYAYQAILKSFYRLASKSNTYRLRFPMEFDPSYEKSDWLDVRREETAEYYSEELVRILQSNSAGLTAMGLEVIKGRFALGSIPSRKTLFQMSRILGMSKERVRQIQKEAVAKLRKALEKRLKTPSACARSVCSATG